jgi:hypothetical protein
MDLTGCSTTYRFRHSLGGRFRPPVFHLVLFSSPHQSVFDTTRVERLPRVVLSSAQELAPTGPRWATLGESPSHLQYKLAGLQPRSRLVPHIHAAAEVRRHRKFPRCALTLHLRGGSLMESATRPLGFGRRHCLRSPLYMRRGRGPSAMAIPCPGDKHCHAPWGQLCIDHGTAGSVGARLRRPYGVSR